VDTPNGGIQVTGNNGQAPVVNNGVTTLPGGGEITLPNNISASVPSGSTVQSDGTVVIGKGTGTINASDGTTVVAPSGSTIEPNGNIVLSGNGASISSPDGTAQLNASTGTVVQPDGQIAVGNGGASLSNGENRSVAIPAGMIISLDEDAPLGFAVLSLSYQDVSERDWYYDAVKFVLKNGLMSGISMFPPQFGPQMETSRAMLATLLYNLADKPAVEGESDFSDVVDGSWYTNAVEWAHDNGVVLGKNEGIFDPNAPISRQDVALALYYYAAYAGLTLPELRADEAFEDDGQIADYAKDAVYALFRSNVISGSNGNYNPNGDVTRAEVAAMLQNFLTFVMNQ